MFRYCHANTNKVAVHMVSTNNTNNYQGKSIKIMKKLIKRIFLRSGRIWSYIFPYKCSSAFSRIRAHLYTGWATRNFKHFGKSIIIPPFRALVGAQYISIGDNCEIRDRVHLTAWDSYRGQRFTPEIIIGNNSSIGSDSHITAINSIKIGNNVRMGDKVLITDNAHGASDRALLDTAPNYRPLFSKGTVIIEDNVWIGEKATILPGVHIGRGCIVGANAVVSKNAPLFAYRWQSDN